ncbi:hypothetical protein KP509_19G024400 [Ceratopteris richardii]|uniref:Uncharacterized protein n=1 Tax=Ceratopteris richardii TaxID=49495 RepID=A0A8T2SMS1_CERRI|nr:hypothetical protein KP509_19G024400 [Ceratopteris richardii]
MNPGANFKASGIQAYRLDLLDPEKVVSPHKQRSRDSNQGSSQ